MRSLSASFSLIAPSPAQFRFCTLPAEPYDVDEEIRLTLDGEPIDYEIEVNHLGTRTIRTLPHGGTIRLDYRSEVRGRVDPWPIGEVGPYLASSRYVNVDDVRDFAEERFGGAEPRAQVEAITRYVRRTLEYSPKYTVIDSTASDTLKAGGGMCRDFAHVTCALGRALGIPTRYVSVYAPNLTPPDFHAVNEVLIDGQWYLVDSTFLAPRSTMVRIATGVDAQATAWSSNSGSTTKFGHLKVEATASEPGDVEPSDALVQLT